MSEDLGDDMELGGNIKLVGFKEISKAELVVVKKMVGSYARKLGDGLDGFEELKVTLKPVHKTAKHEQFELVAGIRSTHGHFEADLTERNLFVGLDAVLSKVSDHAFKSFEKHVGGHTY